MDHGSLHKPLFPFKALDPDFLMTFRVILHNRMRNELKIVTVLVAL